MVKLAKHIKSSLEFVAFQLCEANGVIFHLSAQEKKTKKEMDQGTKV